MPNKGEIYFSTDFLFSDGTRGRKLFIVLNDPRDDEPYIIVKTTSNPPSRQYKELCNPDLKIFYIKAKKEWFDRDTFVQLNEYYPFTQKEFLGQSFNCSLKKCGELSQLCLTQIINCIRRIKEDVPQQYFLLICR